MAKSVGYEGLDSEDAGWIVLDLEIALVHIFSPEARVEYGLDEKLNEESTKPKRIEDDEEAFIRAYAQSLPKKIAGDPMRSEDSEEVCLPRRASKINEGKWGGGSNRHQQPANLNGAIPRFTGATIDPLF